MSAQTRTARGWPWYARWHTVLRFEASLSAAIGLAAGLGWAAGGGYFWPGWVWLGLAIPLGLQAAVRWGLRAPKGQRFLAMHASLSFALGVMLLLIWLLGGARYFWPVWPIASLAIVLGVHHWFVRNRPNAREQALADRVGVLTRTRRGALDVQAAELQRIERDLHDGAQARLVSVAMSLGLAESLLETKPDLIPGLLTEARSTAVAALDDLRTVMQGIQPPVLADRGLEGAIRALALDIAVQVTVTGGLPGRAPLPVESAAYFTAAECLANVMKHSNATSAWVNLRYEAGALSVVVGDNGVGGADVDGGTGLRGVARRLESFDGTMTVSSPAGGPTTVTMEVPCELSSPKT
ncbi:MAG: histidine kinase [Streptosporangiaceae bacterium]